MTKKIKARIGKTSFSVELATTPGQLAKGLMLRKKGRMILSFPYEAKHAIWMACMRFPLDLVFISRDKKIVDLKRNVPTLTYNPSTWRLYKPDRQAKYVLEAEAGFIKKAGIRRGQKISIVQPK